MNGIKDAGSQLDRAATEYIRQDLIVATKILIFRGRPGPGIAQQAAERPLFQIDPCSSIHAETQAKPAYPSVIYRPSLFTAFPVGQTAGSWWRAGGIQLLLQITDVDLDQLAQFRNLQRQLVGADLVLLRSRFGGVAGGAA